MKPDEQPLPGIPQTLQELVSSLDSRGEDIAVIAFHRHEAEQVSYATLARRARRFAGHLAEQMAHAHQQVIVLAPPSPEYMAAALGACWAGAGIVPLDTQMPDDVLRHVMEDCGSFYVVTTVDHAERLKRLFSHKTLTLFLLDAAADASNHWLPESAKEHAAPDRQVDENAVAALFYTSGTTGMPKGVPLTHANLAFQIKTIQDQRLVTAGARVLLPLPLHHVYPFVIGMLTPLALGITIVLPAALTGPQLLRALSAAKVTHLIGIPRLYEALLGGVRARLKERSKLFYAGFKAAFSLSRWLRRRFGYRAGKALLRPLQQRFGPRLHVLASGGAPLPEALARDLEAFGWEVAIGYGLTETAPLITVNPPGSPKLGSVGRVVDGVQLRIAPAAEAPDPQGEVQVRGPCVFHGYHNLGEKTQHAFTDDGWFRTGDLGWLDDEGYLYLNGRLSTLIVTPGGEKVQPDQLEQRYSEHPAIEEIGILQHDGGLVAVIVPDTDAIAAEHKEDVEKAVREAVHAYGQRLPSYQRLSDVVVARESLARTRIGKIKRQELTSRFERLMKGEKRENDEPETPLSMADMAERDRALLQAEAPRHVWDWLTQTYPHTRLGPDTNLQLQLQVDSLKWIEMTQHIREIAGVELDEQAIARIQTVRDLLTAVADAAENVDPTVQTADPFADPEAVLSERQQRWLRLPSGLATGAAWMLYRLNRLLMRVLFRLRVKDSDHLPRGTACIIAPNHTSYLDPFALAAALDFAQLRTTHWAGSTHVLLANAWVRLFARLAQAMPIEPERPSSSLAAGAAILRRQRSLVWFPEGVRSPHGKLQTFKPGIGLLLQHLDVPVVPVYIDGAHAALPPGSWRLRLRRISVTFGEPLQADALMQQGQGSTDHERIAAALRHAVEELSGVVNVATAK